MSQVGLILDVFPWLGISLLVVLDGTNNPVPWELVLGVLLTTVAVVTTRPVRRAAGPRRGGTGADHGTHQSEREVLALLGSGLSNADIASRMFVVEGTVKAHVSAILNRLAVKNRVQAAITAYEAGLVGS